MESSDLSEKQLSVDVFLDEVKRSAKETRPIVVESLAFLLAENDLLEKDHGLTSWKKFKQGVEGYETALLVALGWALAKHGISHETVHLKESVENLTKIYDGSGYYFGFFRHRQTVKNQVFPEFVPQDYQPSFFRGIGRTLWYVSAGNFALLDSLLALFEEKNKASLWTGIGIASTFVGGCTDQQEQELLQLSAIYKDDLIKGVNQAKLALESYGILR